METKNTEYPPIELATQFTARTVIFEHKTNGPGDTWAYGDIDANDPIDRVGGPYRLSGVHTDYGCPDDPFFRFTIADCAFPLSFMVQSRSEYDAYEAFIDWQVDHLKIEEPDLADYDEDSLNYDSNGTPVDIESVMISGPYRIASIVHV